jgi:hypothetical protein
LEGKAWKKQPSSILSISSIPSTIQLLAPPKATTAAVIAAFASMTEGRGGIILFSAQGD